MEKIRAARIQTNGFFKYLLVGNFIGFLILWLGFALLGAVSDNINLYVSGEPLTTAKAFMYAPLAAAMGAIPAAIASWLSITVGFWGWAKFRPLVVEYEPAVENER